MILYLIFNIFKIHYLYIRNQHTFINFQIKTPPISPGRESGGQTGRKRADSRLSSRPTDFDPPPPPPPP